jgi:hypothetical protein
MKILSQIPDFVPVEKEENISRRDFLKAAPLAAVGAVTGVLSSSEDGEAAEQREIKEVFKTQLEIEKYRIKFNCINERRFNEIPENKIYEIINSLRNIAKAEYSGNTNLTPFPKKTGQAREDFNMIINFICTEYSLGSLETLTVGESFGRSRMVMNYIKKHIFTKLESNLIIWSLIKS